jgi:hypothetical protein
MSDFLNKRLVKVVFDTAANDSAGVSNKTAAAHPTGIFIPDNAIITSAFYEVNTTFTSATDTATIAIMVEGAGDVVAALAINDGTNIWDAGVHGTIVGAPTLGADSSHDTAIEVGALTAASFIKVADAEEVTFTVGTDVLTAGKLTLYLEYVTGL